MPNGIDKNWMRMCAAINGFRARFQSWPVRVRLPEDAISGLFTPKSLAKIEEKLTLVEDGSPYIAEDDTGGSYNYGKEGGGAQPDIPAHIWLDVEPDSEAVKAYYQPQRELEKAVSKTQPKLRWKIILLSELVLAALMILIYLITAVFSYNGHCISFEMPRVCSMGKYMGGVLAFMPFAIPILTVQYWWIALPLLVLFPVAGIKLSNRKS
jgi:hypothetical protein